MDTLAPRPAGGAGPGPGRDGVGNEPDRPDRKQDSGDSDVPWAGVGVVVLVLVTGAFASGWHFGRRWGRLMGW